MGGKRFKPPKEEENILRLPSHITLEILSRLPFKTIIHCKSVCKAWRTLLLDPCFLMFYNGGPLSQYWLIEFEEDFRKRKLSKFKDECIVRAGDGLKFEHVVGSCNGLICLEALYPRSKSSTPKKLYFQKLYSTKLYKNDSVILPMPNLKETSDKYCVTITPGFGFCPRTNVYKVIRMVSYRGMASRNEALCEVYTLGTNAWRTIQDVPRPSSFNKRTSVNGAVHWFNDDEDADIWVCAFRIEDEKWDPILLPLPLLDYANLRYNSELGVVENCLAIFDMSKRDIWMMKDYGVRDSWTKCWSIRTDHIPSEKHNPCFLPLKLTKDGNLLMYDRNNQALVCFNPQTRLITRKQKIYGHRRFRYAGPYVASFISPTEVIKKES